MGPVWVLCGVQVIYISHKSSFDTLVSGCTFGNMRFIRLLMFFSVVFLDQLKVYSDHECIKVSYADDDNDLVIIESQEELEEAFKV